MSSEICFILDQSKNVSFGNGLTFGTVETKFKDQSVFKGIRTHYCKE